MCWEEMLSKINSQINSCLALLRDATILWDDYNQQQESGRHRTLQKLSDQIGTRGKFVDVGLVTHGF